MIEKTTKLHIAIFKNIMDFTTRFNNILNDTKVIKSKNFGHKQSGAKIELLLNKPLFMDRFLVMIRGKVKVDTKLLFEDNLSANVIELNEDGSRVVSKDEKN